MKNNVLGIYDDHVIKSKYFVNCADYEFALKYLIPRLSELTFQRAPIEAELYDRLYSDILKGCIMPPITVSIISEPEVFTNIQTQEAAEAFLTENLEGCFILDGIQRLHTLKRIFNDNMNFESEQPLFINFIISDSMDKLLYRMITLNNGQKPMSIRHQVEIIADYMFDFEDVPIKMVTEK